MRGLDTEIMCTVRSDSPRRVCRDGKASASEHPVVSLADKARPGSSGVTLVPLECEIIKVSYEDPVTRDHSDINHILYLSDMTPCSPIYIKRRFELTQSSGSKIKLSEQAATTAVCLLPIIHEEADTVFLRNVTNFLPDVISKKTVLN
jgi:hypothetical protein